MSDLAITAATAITGANTASGDLFPVVDVSASTPKGRSITRDELGTAMVATGALAAALAAKLPLSGGTMTGVLVNSTNGAASTPVLQLTGTPFTGGTATTTKPLALFETTGATSNNWSTSGTMLGVNAPSGFGGNIIDAQVNGVRKFSVDASIGALRLNADTQDTIWRRSDVAMLIFHGQTSSSTGIGSSGYNPGLNLGSVASVRWTNDTPAASPDIVISRAAAACLQMGANHATTPTTQTLKAHNVTTGTGADLVLAGGTGSVAGGSVSLAASVTTGAPTKLIEVFPGGQIAFFGSAGSVQVNTGIAGEMHAPGTGTAVTEDSTFGGYTLMQIIAGLRALGLFN